MSRYRLKLPPHLRQTVGTADLAPLPQPMTGQAEFADRPPVFESAAKGDGPRPVTVTTPLGSVTCPPGRLKLNLLQSAGQGSSSGRR